MKVYIAQQLLNEAHPEDCLGDVKIFDSKKKLNDFMKTIDIEDEYSYWIDFSKEVE